MSRDRPLYLEYAVGKKIPCNHMLSPGRRRVRLRSLRRQRGVQRGSPPLPAGGNIMSRFFPLPALFLLLTFCLPAQAADPTLERFAGPAPAAMLAERTGNPEMATAFTGGWGYTPEDACRIMVPQGSEKKLVGAHASSAQELVVFLRLSLESERAGLVPARIVPTGRTLFLGPQGAVYERLEMEFLAVPKERQTELEAINADTAASEEEHLRRIKQIGTRAAREFWFDITDIRDHNSGVLYGATYKPRAISSRGVSFERLSNAPDLLQRSIYLEVTPHDYLKAGPGASVDPDLVDGGWGYDQASAVVQHLPKGQEGLYQDFVGQQLELVSIRNLLEFTQPLPNGERLQPVDHDKRSQALVEANGKFYDRLLVDVYLVPSADYVGKALPLMQQGTPEAGAALRKMARKVEREFWFDVTEPLRHNGNIFTQGTSKDTPKQ